MNREREENMKTGKTSVLTNSLIWFGAAVSMAEILTGTLIAPLGFAKGAAAILLGHFIGCILLFAAGLIGGRTGKSSMETVKMSFGQKGSLLFSSLNVIQLIGWTAVMIVSGASAAAAVAGTGMEWIWSAVIGALILIWILTGITHISKLNTVAMGALFALTVALSAVIFKGDFAYTVSGQLSFGAAVELSAAMPLSWLPLISDYTRNARRPLASSFASSAVYFAASSWMYLIGLGAALFTGESDVAAVMAGSGLGLAALLIVIFSTVTTTFLDASSAGISAVSISGKIKEKPAALTVCVIGTLLAIFTPITQLENFLYLIGSVFAPMIAIQIADFYLLGRDASDRKYAPENLIIWAAGFALYRIFLHIDTPLGNTFPVMFIVIALCVIVSKLRKTDSSQ